MANKEVLKCTECDYVPAYKNALKIHSKTVHEKIRAHKCNFCEYSAGQSGTLKKHVKMVHLKLRPFKCEKCGAPFALKHELAKHVLRVHDKVPGPSFPCPKCDFVAKNFKHTLTAHIKAVHEKIRDHKCDQCSYAASQSGVLVRHIRNMHTPDVKYIPCPYCNYRCKEEGTMRIHVKRIHLTNKGHNCTMCVYSARTLAALQRHTQIAHTNISDAQQNLQFNCPHCEYSTGLG